LAKIYEVILIFCNWITESSAGDPTNILVENYTPDQTKAQQLLDLIPKDDLQPEGELLVIIPFRNRWDLTRDCLSGLGSQSLPPLVQLKTILVDNRSNETETIRESVKAPSVYPQLNVSILKANYDFNYSKLNNDAFREFSSSSTKWVLFLNNDIQLKDPTIVSRMLSTLVTVKEVGVTGCTLLYPTRHIQHLFAAPGIKIVAAHPLKHTLYDDNLKWFAKKARPVAAVTGAFMMVRATDFVGAGLFDENLPTLGQDIILCLAIENKLKKFSVSLSTGGTLHLESRTKIARFPLSEIAYIYQQYGPWLTSRKWLSEKFSRWSEKPLKKFFPEGEYPVKDVVKYWE
jgi:hypothetical protein